MNVKRIGLLQVQKLDQDDARHCPSDALAQRYTQDDTFHPGTEPLARTSMYPVCIPAIDPLPSLARLDRAIGEP